MRADYDSEAGTLEIELEPVERLERADDSVHPRAIVHLLDGRPAIIDLLGAAPDVVEEPLAAVAAAYGLDREALIAAARSALAAPDRRIELEISAKL